MTTPAGLASDNSSYWELVILALDDSKKLSGLLVKLSLVFIIDLLRNLLADHDKWGLESSGVRSHVRIHAQIKSLNKDLCLKKNEAELLGNEST